MRQQLNEIKTFDQYILCQLSAEDKCLLDARMILSPLLKKRFHQQVQLHRVILCHGRERLRSRLNLLHEDLMKNSGFNEKIHSYFK